MATIRNDAVACSLGLFPYMDLILVGKKLLVRMPAHPNKYSLDHGLPVDLAMSSSDSAGPSRARCSTWGSPKDVAVSITFRHSLIRNETL